MKAPQQRDENPCRPRHFRPAPCAPAPIEGPAKQSIEMSHTRLIIAGALFCLAFLVIGTRLVEVGGLKGGETRLAHIRIDDKSETRRADIVDRNGALLATTLETSSLYANPRQITDARRTAQQIISVLPDLVESEVYAKLTSPEKSFVWIKRQLTPRQEFEVNRLGIVGLQFQPEERRVYPEGSLAAHVVGYAGIDNKGLAGLERGFDEVLRDRHRPLELSLDLRL
ncbi:MAG TPA: penicillin-binding protein 2, partial [Stellaceae bacterium]|nr:penicillin-binding protein 2 [Stellaceae bacterium]